MPEGSIMPDDKNYGVAYVPLDVWKPFWAVRTRQAMYRLLLRAARSI
jgi:hypothetical protein